MKLDRLNRKIIQSLQKNAKQSNTEIAKKIGISSTSVGERIKKMEQQGIIEGYFIKLSNAKIGYPLKAIITIRPFINSDEADQILKTLKSFEEIIHFYRVTGDESVILECVFRDHKHLEKFLDTILKYGETKTLIVLSETPNMNSILAKEE